MEYMSAKEADDKWGISQKRISVIYNKDEEKEVKPFLKWAGGKGQLLREIEKYYPFADSHITKYAEPFVGGGAVLFDILSKYNLKEVYIGDINAELINAYRIIRDNIDTVIPILFDIILISRSVISSASTGSFIQKA